MTKAREELAKLQSAFDPALYAEAQQYWEAKKGEIFVLNSSELRAVQGHQKNDFILSPINPPQQRAQKSRSAKGAKGAKAQELVYPASQEWALDLDVDVDTRRVCEAS